MENVVGPSPLLHLFLQPKPMNFFYKSIMVDSSSLRAILSMNIYDCDALIFHGWVTPQSFDNDSVLLLVLSCSIHSSFVNFPSVSS